MMTYSAKNTVEIDSCESNKKIRVFKKPYEHLLKKKGLYISELRVTDTKLICKYSTRGATGEMHLNDLSHLIK